ncbi:hypothetical protein ACN99C_26965 (plasmid) [Pseudomonas alloputida]|uniref:hypothetical protein n=1 Tax=Pseudomonas alloputida TaxID=1940621 RepID=UPI003B42F62A
MIKFQSGMLSRTVNRVSVIRQEGDSIVFDWLKDNESIEKVETTVSRLKAEVATVVGANQITHVIDTDVAELVMMEAERQFELLDILKNRALALALIYRHTHADYKGTLRNGAKTIWLQTGLVVLEELPDIEIVYRLPTALKKEQERLKKEDAKARRRAKA